MNTEQEYTNAITNTRNIPGYIEEKKNINTYLCQNRPDSSWCDFFLLNDVLNTEFFKKNREAKNRDSSSAS